MYSGDLMLFFIHYTIATNQAKINIHVSIFEVGNINNCLVYILKIVKMQNLEVIYE